MLRNLVLLLFIFLCSCQTKRDSTLVLFNGQNLKNWKVSNFGSEGEVVFKEGTIHMGYGYPLTGITWDGPELPRDNYAIELEAIKKEGIDFFVGLTFPVRDAYCSLILGGWGGSTCGLSSFDYSDASENETSLLMDFDLKRWYKIRMEVNGEQLKTFVDGKKIIDTKIMGRKVHVRPEVEPSKPLGISAFETVVAYRNIKLIHLN